MDLKSLINKSIVDCLNNDVNNCLSNYRANGTIKKMIDASIKENIDIVVKQALKDAGITLEPTKTETEEITQEQQTTQEESDKSDEYIILQNYIKRIHIIKNEINKEAQQVGSSYTDEKYRKDLKEKYGVESSKQLTIQQADDFLIYLDAIKEQTIKFVKKKAAEKNKQQSNSPLNPETLIDEAQEAFGTPSESDNKSTHRDFVKEAKISMLMKDYAAGKPLYVADYLDLGIDLATVPEEKIIRK